MFAVIAHSHLRHASHVASVRVLHAGPVARVTKALTLPLSLLCGRLYDSVWIQALREVTALSELEQSEDGSPNPAAPKVYA